MFSRLGRIVLSADLIAKNLTATDPEIRSELRKAFGPAIFASDGTLDRKELGRIAFRNRSLLRKLNSVIHPKVIAHIEREVSSLSSELRHPYIVVEAALIYEAKLDSMFDYVIVVDAPLKDRLERVSKRDELPKDEVLMRGRTQMSTAEKIEKADFVIANRQGEKELEDRVLFVDRVLQRLLIVGQK